MCVLDTRVFVCLTRVCVCMTRVCVSLTRSRQRASAGAIRPSPRLRPQAFRKVYIGEQVRAYPKTLKP